MNLSNRELATLLWGTGFVFWAGIKNPSLWKSVWGIFESLLHRTLLGPIVFLVLYLSVIVWFLYSVGFWIPSLLKDTVIWFLFSGMVMAFSVVERPGEERWLQKLVARSVGALFLVEFLTGTYNFALWIELILVPYLFSCGTMAAVASTDEKYALVKKLVETLIGVTGLVIIGFSLIQAFQDFGNLADLQTARELALPVVLTLLLLPAVAPMAIQSGYEQVFIRMRLDESRWYRLKARIRLVREVGLRPRRIGQFRRQRIMDVVLLRSKEDFEEFIRGLDGWKPTPEPEVPEKAWPG